jgi:hypothetical protein
MMLTDGEVMALVAVGAVLAAIVSAYMIFTRRRGWM